MSSRLTCSASYGVTGLFRCWYPVRCARGSMKLTWGSVRAMSVWSACRYVVVGLPPCSRCWTWSVCMTGRVSPGFRVAVHS